MNYRPLYIYTPICIYIFKCPDHTNHLQTNKGSACGTPVTTLLTLSPSPALPALHCRLAEPRQAAFGVPGARNREQGQT